MIYAAQLPIGQPGPAYCDGCVGISQSVTLPADGTVVIHASGTAWGESDGWVNVLFDGVPYGNMAMRHRNPAALTSVVVVVPFVVAAGQHLIELQAAGGARYDSADRFNVTVMQYSK